MARIVFYCNETKAHLNVFEYYKQDIEALERLGHDVIVCTRYHEIPLRFDAMFVWWWTYAFWPVLLCKILRKPCLVTGTYNFELPAGYDRSQYHNRPPWQRALIAFSTRCSALNLFINASELRSVTKFFKLSNGRIFPHTVHDDYKLGPAQTRDLAVFSLAWSDLGNLKRKGTLDLIYALKLLKDEGLAVRAFLAGPRGDGTEHALRLIEELQVGDLVTWLGPLERSEKIDFMRKCELYAQPSHSEGFGLAIAEAMGCGACIITCDVGSVRDVVGSAGIYVTPGAPRELADAIRRAVENSSFRHRLQDQAVARARAEFDFGVKAERLRSYLLEVGVASAR